MMNKNSCPYCNARNPIPQTAITNVSNYGDNTFHVLCTKCLQPIRVSLSRVVILNYIEKSTKDEEDCEVW